MHNLLAGCIQYVDLTDTFRVVIHGDHKFKTVKNFYVSQTSFTL